MAIEFFVIWMAHLKKRDSILDDGATAMGGVYQCYQICPTKCLCMYAGVSDTLLSDAIFFFTESKQYKKTAA